MKRVFLCSDCDKIFVNNGKKVEEKHPIFGPISHYEASCPDCKQSVNEHKKPLSSSKSSGASCATGACPFVN